MKIISTLPKFIKLQKDKFTKYGVSKDASGEYERKGTLYQPTDVEPHRCNVTFSLNGVLANEDDFEIIIKDTII